MDQAMRDSDRDMAQVIEHDPVCGAAIVDEASAPSIDYAGQRRWFCSETCRDCFLDEPDRFLMAEDLGEEIAAERSDGEAGVLRDGEPYLDS